MPEETENLSPIKRCYRKVRFSGLILETNKPWSLILFIYHMIMLNYVGTAAVLDILQREKNLIDFVQAISAVMIYVHNNAKAVNIYKHKKEVKELFDRLDKFSMEISQDKVNENQYEARQQSFHVKFISIYTKALLWLSPFSFVTGVIGDYMSGFVKPHIPYQLWLPWKMKEFWSYLAGMFFVTMLELTTCVFYSSFTIILFTFTNEVSTCLTILQARLETRGSADKNIYKHHAVIMQLLQEYNNIFSGPLYIETLVSTLQPCGFLYTFIKVFKNYNPANLELIIKALLCVAAPYIVCSCGQEISSQMEQLHRSAYACKWYEERPKVRKDLLTLMTMTTKRIDLNYRKFISYNYVCLATVFQGIYSYLTMIINIEAD